ncbi:MAG: PilZ domain-containing protein [Gammaproteobacteria bacterium]|nr:PilZ domain-containing protein [Gammaproteobacteria bacterium]
MSESFLSWEEKRAFDRIPTNSEVWVRNVSSFLSDPLRFELGDRCNLNDLSFGGARFTAQRAICNVGDRIEVVFPRPGGTLSLTGEVVRENTGKGDAQMLAMRMDRLPIMEQVHLTRTLKELAGLSSKFFRRRPLSPLRTPTRH